MAQFKFEKSEGKDLNGQFKTKKGQPKLYEYFHQIECKTGWVWQLSDMNGKNATYEDLPTFN